MIKKEKNMFLNTLIIITLFILLVLIGIKFNNLLSILAIILSIVALIPFVAATFIYFNSAPEIEYTIANKSVEFNEKQNRADLTIGFRTKGGQCILTGIHLIPKWGYNLSSHPVFKNKFRMKSLEEGFGGITFEIDKTNNLISDHQVHSVGIGFEKEDRKPIKNIELKFIHS